MQRNRQVIVLAILLVVLGAVVVYEWPEATPSAPSAAPPPAPRARGTRGAAPSGVPPIEMAAIEAARARPAPPPAARNPFVFQPKIAPPPPPAVRAGAGVAGPGGAGPAGAGDSAVPAGPPPPPPIPFKFIGIVQAPDKKLAVLMDTSTRDVFYGREGDVIDGRYRILRIAVESIEMAYVDGRGRQTIRLTGA